MSIRYPFFFYLAVGFALSRCFEYEEVLVFNKNQSGYVEVTYQIPLKSDKTTSLIRHLPATEREIRERLEKGFRKPGIAIRDYKFELLNKGQFSEPFFDFKGKVSYKLDFEEIADIERSLPGNMITKAKGRTITIRREFPSLTQEYLTAMSVGEKKILAEIAKLLKEGTMRFRVNFPASTECISNRGVVNLGSLSYTYFLIDSLEESSGKTWEYKLRFF